MDGWMDVARMAYGVQTYGLSRLERLMVTHRRYIILERMWDGMGERKGGRNALAPSLEVAVRARTTL